MRKLRLLVTKKCNRSCEGCCNNDWELDKLPVLRTSFPALYNEVLITGGEPMLFPEELCNLVNSLRSTYSKSLFYVYTAYLYEPEVLLYVLSKIDGITLTLHDQDDVLLFMRLCRTFDKVKHLIKNKSLRLNVFENVILPEDLNLELWKVKEGMVWIKNCPLPMDEEFRRLNKLF